MDDLLTARLVLHPMTVAEAQRVVAAAPQADDQWASGYPTEGDVAAARGYLGVCASVGDPRPFGVYQIRLRDDGHAIGGLGFHGGPDHANRVEIGYGLIQPMRGRGYAREALRGLLVFARVRGIHRVGGVTTADNVASQQVMIAVGMRLVAENLGLKRYEIVLTGGG